MVFSLEEAQFLNFKQAVKIKAAKFFRYLLFMWEKIYKSLLAVFIFFWITFIFMDYWQNHLQYLLSFRFFQYTNLTIILAVLGAGLWWLYNREMRKKSLTTHPWFTGLSVFLLGTFIIMLSVYMFQRKVMNISFPIPFDFFNLVWNIFELGFYTWFIIVACYSMGMYTLGTFRFRVGRAARPILAIGAGIMVWVFIMFVLGLFGFLKWYVLLTLMLLIILITRKVSFRFMWNTLFAPISIDFRLSPLGMLSFYVLLIVVSLNFIQVLIPMPKGWDSVSLYLNLSSLVHDYSGLVQGHQPYNWSLFMALGFILFEKAEVAMALSALGGFLSIFALYYLCRDWLKININYSLLCVLLFYLLPTIGHQSYLDLKVDLGLLFTMLIIVILLVEWWRFLASGEDRAAKVSKRYVILLGLFTGFALGIKLTALMIFFAVAGAIWYVYSGRIAFLAVFCMSTFAVLLFKLDDLPKLRQFHLSAETFMWVMLAFGLLFFAWSAIREKHLFWQPAKLSVLYACFFLLPVLPWLTKNYIETGGDISIRGLTYGKTQAPKANATTFQKNWERAQAKEKRERAQKRRVLKRKEQRAKRLKEQQSKKKKIK